MIPTDTKNDTLQALLARRILLLDGGFGTMVQGYGLQEEAYRGERFRTWDIQLKGCNDLLALTRPEVVREIHEKYLAAGADIIETDSFNANAVSLADYRLEAWQPTPLRRATRRNPASSPGRWAPRTARPRCRPTWPTPRPAR